MNLTKVLITFVLALFYIVVVEGCGRIKCYKCNSQDSPSTCGENNFNAEAHKDDTVSGSTLRNTDNPGTSCIQGYAVNDQGTYYYRDKSNKALWDGCTTPQTCACNEDLCNANGTGGTCISSSLFFICLVSAVIQKII